MAIPRETVDRIFDAAKIEDVVGDYVGLKRRGANLWGLCPFHQEKTPSFSVNPARNIYKCFSCGKGGSAVGFIMEIEHCSYPDALKILAKKYHIEIQERELTQEEQQVHDDRESMFVVNDWAHEWFQQQLWETEEGRAIGLSYFHQRGLRDETIRRFGLGYCPAKGNQMTAAAQQKQFEDRYLYNDAESRIGTGILGRREDKTGKMRLYDRFSDRVIFPFYSVSGKHIGFAGRILVNKENVGKYVNSPESLVYTKGRELYGLFQAKHAVVKAKKCYLVEGQMDCISMSQAGIENVVCSGGTSLTRQQIALLHRFTENVTLLYDGDAAGIHGALRGIDLFLEEGLIVKVMLFPDGDDPDSFARKHTAEEVVAFIQTHEEDFLRYQVRTLMAQASDDVQKRSEAIRSIVHSISLISDRILRNEYIKLCCQMMQTDVNEITLSVKNERRKRFNAKDTTASVQPDPPSPNNGGTKSDLPSAETNSTNAFLPPREDIGGASSPFSRLDTNYRNLLLMLIRYGDYPLHFAGADGKTLTYLVGDYMQLYMQSANLQLTNPLYQSFFEEFNKHKTEPEFAAEKCFVRNTNQYISQLATELLASQLSLATAKEPNADQLTDNEIRTQVIHLLYELHLSAVENSLCVIDKQMLHAQQMNDDQLLTSLMQTQMQLSELKREITKLLGQN